MIVDRVRGALTHHDRVVRWSASDLLVVLLEPSGCAAIDVVLDDAGCPHPTFVAHRPGSDLRQFLEDVVAAAGPRPTD